MFFPGWEIDNQRHRVALRGAAADPGEEPGDAGRGGQGQVKFPQACRGEIR